MKHPTGTRGLAGDPANRGPVLAAVAVVAGAVTGERLGGGAGQGALLVALLGGAGALSCARRARWRAAALLALLCLALLATASMQRALDGLDGPLARLASRSPDVVASIRLTDDPRAERWRGARVLARVEALEGGPAQGNLVLVVARGATGGRLRLLACGERAVISGRLRPLAEFERRLRWRHVAAALDATDLRAVGPVRSPLLRVADRLRTLVLAGSAALPEPERALAAGFLVGDDRDLPSPVAHQFRASGLSHLLAVSGANVALVLAVAGPALRRLSLAGRLAGGLGVLLVFGAMTRFEPSVLRASVMAAMCLLAAFLGRPASGLRVLALAVIVLVLVDPFLVHSIGFRLSCAASAGIVVLAPALAARLPGPRCVREPLAVTAAAQLGVAPVALPTFGGLSLVALPANLLAAPAAVALTVWGLTSGFAGGLLEAVSPGASVPLQLPTGVLATYIAGVASLAASFPMTMTPRGVLGVVTVGALVTAGFLTFRRRGPLQAEEPIERRQARSQEHQGERAGGDEQVDLETAWATARRGDEASLGLHHERDGQELRRQEDGPDAREQADEKADAADKLQDDNHVADEAGQADLEHLEVPHAVGEAPGTPVDLEVAVVGEHRADHGSDGQRGEIGVKRNRGRGKASHGFVLPRIVGTLMATGQPPLRFPAPCLASSGTPRAPGSALAPAAMT